MYQAIVFLPLLGFISRPHLDGRRAGALSRRARGRSLLMPRRPRYPRAHGPYHACTAAHAAHAEPHEHEPAAQGSRLAEAITTTLLFIAAALSWIAFVQVGFFHQRCACHARLVHSLGRSQGRLGAAHRYADGGDAGGGDDGVVARASLFGRLHGRRSLPPAVLRLSVAVHLRDADAGDGRQSRPVVLRLGGRRSRELSADRVLVSQAGSQRGRDQGVRRQPRRRLRLRARHFRRVHDDRRGRSRNDLRAGAGAGRQDASIS